MLLNSVGMLPTSFPVNPVAVDGGEVLHRSGSVLAPLTADEDPVGVEQVADGAPLGKELWVGQHLREIG